MVTVWLFYVYAGRYRSKIDRINKEISKEKGENFENMENRENWTKGEALDEEN